MAGCCGDGEPEGRVVDAHGMPDLLTSRPVPPRPRPPPCLDRRQPPRGRPVDLAERLPVPEPAGPDLGLEHALQGAERGLAGRLQMVLGHRAVLTTERHVAG